MIRIFFFFFICFLLFSCQNKDAFKKELYRFDIRNLTDVEYPDNPDIGFRSKDYEFNYFTSGEVKIKDDECDFVFYSTSDSITIYDYPISEFIPTIPEAIKPDEYLSYLSLINQEWNRNQVKLNTTEFNTENNRVSSVDLARNCLNAYLWEIILFENKEGKEIPFAHGWFNFPQSLYAELFEKRNGIPFEHYKIPLENWVDPQCKQLALNTFRKIIRTVPIQYEDRSDTMYPLTHARLKKYKEIIYPKSFTSMRELQSDSTLFATFSPPGIYSKLDPRTTELGRIHKLSSVELNEIISSTSGDTLHEIILTFNDRSTDKITDITFGGLDLSKFPVLSPMHANKAWKSSMGFSNHSFYESLEEFRNHKTKENPYYAYMRDEEKNWLDSHKVGIDGPLIHWDDEDSSKLHIWFLSFERHALVGHYIIKIKE